MAAKDLEEVEEWNEYGELQENVGAGAPAKLSTPSASTSATPSKPPAAPMQDLSNRAGGEAQTPVTLAMRQAAEEAARKAGGGKTQNADAGSGKAGEAGSETLRKLDHSAPVPPPSGTTEASAAIAGEPAESSSKSKAGESATSSTSSVERAALDVPKGAVVTHRGSNVSLASAEEIRSLEQSLAITEEDEPDEEVEAGHESTRSNQASATSRATDTDAQQDLPGSRTQDQPAASAADAGLSVAD